MRIVIQTFILRSASVLLAFTVLVTGVFCQRNWNLKARVLLPNGSPSQNIKVRLEGPEGEIIRDSFTDSTGSFEVRSLSTGRYTIVVPTDDRTYATTAEHIEITRYSPDTVSISVNLNALEERKSVKSSRHTVSVREADNSIPKKAREAYKRSVDLSRRGKTREAIEELKRAIAVYPEYVHAYNDLGVAYIKLDLIDDAIKALEKSISLDPRALNPRLNLGIANVRIRDYARAEQPLREALTIDETAPLVHLYLGITFWKTDRFSEAENEFARALSLGGSEIAIAHYYLGQLYAERDRIEEAVAELEAYIKQKPASEDAQQARQKIAELRSRK
ncbi:MAG TPA: tetratricopeptide repeat protein [Blastocatellia bacterium]|nr:tetratricopeptide repeat protein [Blastocatellia bacterium]